MKQNKLHNAVFYTDSNSYKIMTDMINKKSINTNQIYSIAKVLHIRHPFAIVQPMTDRNTTKSFLDCQKQSTYTLQDLTRKEHGYAHWCIDTKNGTKWWYYITFGSFLRTDLINKWKQSDLSSNHIAILIDGDKYCWMQMNKIDLFMKSDCFVDKNGNKLQTVKDQYDTDSRTGEKLEMLWREIPSSNTELDTRTDFVMHISKSYKFIYRNVSYSNTRNRNNYIYVNRNGKEILYKSIRALYLEYKENFAVKCNSFDTFKKYVKGFIINHSVTEQSVVNAMTLNNKANSLNNLKKGNTDKEESFSTLELAMIALGLATDMGCDSRPVESETSEEPRQEANELNITKSNIYDNQL